MSTPPQRVQTRVPAKLSSNPAGELQLEGVSIQAMQIVTLPRTLDSDDLTDGGPDEQLHDILHRLRGSLAAWMQSLDQLKR